MARVDRNELLKELKSKSREANKRINAIRRNYGDDSWAMKKLNERLEREQTQGKTTTGKVRASKDMSTLQIRETLKATEKFLNSKTSTIEGIEEVRKRQIETIRENLEDIKSDVSGIPIEELDISFQDAQAMYGIFEDDDTRSIVDKLGGSPVYRLIAEASERKMNVTSFQKQMKTMIEGENDVDFKKQLNRIYNKYVDFKGKKESKFI